MAQKVVLHRTTPESQGISSAAILAFIKDIDENINEMHSFMLIRHGQVVAEAWWAPFAPQFPHMLFSLTKSFTSTAVGFAVSEGRMSIDDQVLSFFPEDAPKHPGKNLAAMSVRHLLTMSTGHTEDSTQRTTSRADGNWIKGFFSMPVKHKPGAPFVYNSGASHILSAIVQKVVEMPILDYLRPRLFEPLGIQDMTWETDPRGINTGGWGLNLRTEDIARFGQMYLQKGFWDGKRILPEEWVSQSTSKQVSNERDVTVDWRQGYGFQFWRCQHNAFRGDGAFGQYCIVMPDQDAVLAITSSVADMQAVLDRVWQHLLPAMKPAPLPADETRSHILLEKIQHLKLNPPGGKTVSLLTRQVSGKVYTFAENPMGVVSLAADFSGKSMTLTIIDASAKHTLFCGTEGWVEGKTTLFRGTGRVFPPAPLKPLPVAGACTWTAEDTLLITARFYETPFIYSITCKFDGNQVKVDSAVNMSLMPAEPMHLIGQTG